VLAFLRQSADESLLIVINMDQEPMTEYSLSLANSKLSGALTATELMNGAEVTAPTLDEQGGFANYKPIPELAPRTGYVIRLEQ
jgi:hypothetical protein